MAELISDDKLAPFMKKVPEWDLEEEDSLLIREFEFDEFMEAIDFVNSVAEIADDAEHHPKIEVNETVVKLFLRTLDQGGLTKLDFELAIRIDTLVD